MKRTPLRTKGSSPIAQCKTRIQDILRRIVIRRDKVCVYGMHPDATPCDPTVLQCDHLEGRSNPRTYHESKACILVCKKHHGWKSFSSANKEVYDRRVKEIIGEERWQWIQETAQDKKDLPYSEKQWLAIEQKLIEEYKSTMKNGL
jgi:hypothetical protein